jgi:hypothetical protein
MNRCASTAGMGYIFGNTQTVYGQNMLAGSLSVFLSAMSKESTLFEKARIHSQKQQQLLQAGTVHFCNFMLINWHYKVFL